MRRRVPRGSSRTRVRLTRRCPARAGNDQSGDLRLFGPRVIARRLHVTEEALEPRLTREARAASRRHRHGGLG
jgi:hypothetical protein